MVSELPRAIVLGVNGQDGSYLAEHLLAEGAEVIGVGRQPASRYIKESPRYTYAGIDLAQGTGLPELLERTRPARIYHVAAIHGAAGFFYEDSWQDALAVNVGSVHHCLEYARTSGGNVRLLYASSVKAFGAETPKVVNEDLLRPSTCLYSITKNASTDLIDYYRKRHGARATTVFLFNHDSPRRPAQFFLPRVTAILARALKGETSSDRLRSLDFACDWGSAREFMQISATLLEHEANQDYVLATGKTWTGLEFTEALFRSAGLDWRQHVALEKPPGSEPVHMYHADISRLIGILGRAPAESALDVARWILEENHGLRIDAPSHNS